MSNISTLRDRLVRTVKSINPRHKHSWIFSKQVFKLAEKTKKNKKYELQYKEVCDECNSVRFISRS